jgi:hypothetical protein
LATCVVPSVSTRVFRLWQPMVGHTGTVDYLVSYRHCMYPTFLGRYNGRRDSRRPRSCPSAVKGNHQTTFWPAMQDLHPTPHVPKNICDDYEYANRSKRAEHLDHAHAVGDTSLSVGWRRPHATGLPFTPGEDGQRQVWGGLEKLKTITRQGKENMELMARSAKL